MVRTQYQMEVNPESLESLQNMILHDAFMIQTGNDLWLRCVRVVGGMLYIIRDASPTFVPFGQSYSKELLNE